MKYLDEGDYMTSLIQIQTH